MIIFVDFEEQNIFTEANFWEGVEEDRRFSWYKEDNWRDYCSEEIKAYAEDTGVDEEDVDFFDIEEMANDSISDMMNDFVGEFYSIYEINNFGEVNQIG